MMFNGVWLDNKKTYYTCFIYLNGTFYFSGAWSFDHFIFNLDFFFEKQKVPLLHSTNKK